MFHLYLVGLLLDETFLLLFKVNTHVVIVFLHLKAFCFLMLDLILPEHICHSLNVLVAFLHSTKLFWIEHYIWANTFNQVSINFEQKTYILMNFVFCYYSIHSQLLRCSKGSRSLVWPGCPTNVGACKSLLCTESNLVVKIENTWPLTLQF